MRDADNDVQKAIELILEKNYDDMWMDPSAKKFKSRKKNEQKEKQSHPNGQNKPQGEKKSNANPEAQKVTLVLLQCIDFHPEIIETQRK